MTTSSARRLLQEVRSLIPPLVPEAHKGQAGRVGVVGGSHDYTGAPYYASMSSMRLGADMGHIICEPGAGNVIKTYSPDLIVHRSLDEGRSLDDIEKEVGGILKRLHSIVIGPGLGRDDHMQSCARLAISLARKEKLYILIDADGLWLVQNDPSVIKGYSNAVLTPNVVEFGRLCEKLQIEKDGKDHASVVKALAKSLDGPVLLVKGSEDYISDGNEVLIVSAEGGLKRCGGQGDILAGCGATFLAWASIRAANSHPAFSKGTLASSSRGPLLAAYGASVTARACSREAYRRLGRAMLANDLLDEIGKAYEELWEPKQEEEQRDSAGQGDGKL